MPVGPGTILGNSQVLALGNNGSRTLHYKPWPLATVTSNMVPGVYCNNIEMYKINDSQSNCFVNSRKTGVWSEV